jgi:hypothetical protein
MVTRFETETDLKREEKASALICNHFGLNKKKLGKNDIDFEIYKNDNFLFYLEVKGRKKNIDEAYPLPVSVKKLTKLYDKKKPTVILWACDDGIIFSRTEKLKGSIRVSGRPPRDGSRDDREFMAYYNKCNNLKEIKYEAR